MESRPILGLTEEVTILNPPRSEKAIARIDTGATSSSIDLKLAQKLHLKEVNHFKIIKSASGIGRRPVIHIKIFIKGQELDGDFTLANRSHMTYSLLIGQNILKKGRFLIDPLEEFEKRNFGQKKYQNIPNKAKNSAISPPLENFAHQKINHAKFSSKKA